MILVQTWTHIVMRSMSQENHLSVALSAMVVGERPSVGVAAEDAKVEVDFQDATVVVIGITNRNHLGVNVTAVVWLTTMQIHAIFL